MRKNPVISLNLIAKNLSKMNLQIINVISGYKGLLKND